MHRHYLRGERCVDERLASRLFLNASPFGNAPPDRMLVRVSHTDADSVGTAFDENQNRITQHLEYEDWSEFMVVWRKGRLELYEDYAS